MICEVVKSEDEGMGSVTGGWDVVANWRRRNEQSLLLYGRAHLRGQ